MNRIQRILCGVALVAALASPFAQAQNIPGAAARVNGVEISNHRLEGHLDDYLKSKRRNLTSMINPKVFKKLKREALDQLIEREVLWQAAKAEGITIANDEIDAVFQQSVAQFKTRDAFQRQLQKSGFDDSSYREYLRHELAGARYLLQASSKEPEVSEEDIVKVYEGNKDAFSQPELFRARHILLQADGGASAARAAARTRIEGLLAELRNGADFAEMARRHSEDKSASLGGDLGEFARGRMVKPFEDALLALQPGEISGIVETRFGYHIIKLEGRTPAKVPTLDEAREKIRQRLIAERKTEAAREHTQNLIAKAKVEILIRLDSPD